jgi:hypothetical protein
MDVEKLRAPLLLAVTHDEGLLKKRINQMRKTIGEACDLLGVADRPDNVNPKALDNLLCSLGIVDDDDGIEPAAPKRVREAKDLA